MDPSVEMVSFLDFKYFYGLFYIFGQAPYYPFHDRAKIQAKILMFLPFAILVANVQFCSLVFILNEHKRKEKCVGTVIYVLKFIGFAPSFVVIYMNLIRPFELWSVNDKIYAICDLLKSKLETQFPLNVFTFEFCRDLFVSLTVTIVTYFSRVSVSTIYHFKTECIIFVMQLYKTMAIFHVLFYLNIFKLILSSMSGAFNRKGIDSVNLTQVILNAESQRIHRKSTICLRQTGYIYLKLWEVIRIFNMHFGWSFIAIILELVVSATTAIYGFFLYFVASHECTFYITRNLSF